MFCKTSLIIYIFFSSLSVAFFGHNTQREIEEVLLAQLNASHKIISYASEAIKGYEGGKLYLDESKLYETDSGSFINLSDGEKLFIPQLSKDLMGTYLITLSMVNSKFFKNVCNRCNYEWSGGVFDIWCPNCGSTDWVTVRDRG